MERSFFSSTVMTWSVRVLKNLGSSLVSSKQRTGFFHSLRALDRESMGYSREDELQGAKALADYPELYPNNSGERGWAATLRVVLVTWKDRDWVLLSCGPLTISHAPCRRRQCMVEQEKSTNLALKS